MFGWKKANDQCPFCGYGYEFKFKPKSVTPHDPPIPFKETFGEVDKFECHFCKRSLVVLYSHQDKKTALEDELYMQLEIESANKEEQYIEQSEAIEDQLGDLDFGAPEAIKLSKQLEKQLEKLEKEFARWNATYEKKTEKYWEQSERAQRRLPDKESKR